jgi:putative Mn2+ efflux pump MntP
MEIISVFAIAIALALDAFSVSISAGMAIKTPTLRHYFRLAFHFGLFQFVMPLLGYAAGAGVERWIRSFDHWVAFGLLAFIGARMVFEAFGDEAGKGRDPSHGWQLVVLSLATSIDALAVGLSFGVLGRPILVPSAVIGIVCASFSAAGIFIGARASSFAGKRAEALGGVILIAIGLKILLEHLRA